MIYADQEQNCSVLCLETNGSFVFIDCFYRNSLNQFLKTWELFQLVKERYILQVKTGIIFIMNVSFQELFFFQLCLIKVN